MKNEMQEIDLLIKETLSEEEAKFYDALDEQNVFEMLFGLFKGKQGWINLLLNVVIFISFIVFIYCGYQFFNTDSPAEMMRWGIGSIILFISISVSKLYLWMQMDKNALLREMKRLELQVMSLSAREKMN